ncbi:hypothetical protein H2200_010587 [Cladophialophora chaetospira]|uniref:Uncharacterized protein n=1 Tax=Cladophialophora chaetospira TaxID=386627 RepID=A0AA39CEH2_9EURO|nr:hypothetical protein H2200_010587 [Cladophialophora chaetospira]
MDLYRLFVLLLLACSCKAGPVVVLIGGEAMVDALAAGTSAAASAVASWVGLGASSVFYGDFVIVDGALYYGTRAAGIGMLAEGAAGAVAGAAAGGAELMKITDSKLKSSILASISAASRASVASYSRALASFSIPSAGAANPALNPAKDPFTFKTAAATRPPPKNPNPPPSGTPGSIPPPPGTPVSTLPPAQRPSEVPPGVPEYNFRMCQYDIIRMGQNKVNLLFDQPAAQSESLPPD